MAHRKSKAEREAVRDLAKAKLQKSLAALDPETRKSLAKWARHYRESGKLEEEARRIAHTAGKLQVFLLRAQQIGLARAAHELEAGVLKLDGPETTGPAAKGAD